MQNKKIEFRSNFEFNEESKTISGYAIVFDSWSEDMGFREIIRKGAVSQELIDNSDVILNVNHDDEKMLARCTNGKGTLKLELREEGLYFECEAPDTTLGHDMLYHIQNGNYRNCSFAFMLDDDENSQRWYKNDEGKLCREIFTIAGLFDCSIVTTPAYSATSVQARSLDAEKALKEIEEREREEEKQRILRSLDERLQEFYSNI